MKAYQVSRATHGKGYRSVVAVKENRHGRLQALLTEWKRPLWLRLEVMRLTLERRTKYVAALKYKR